MMALLGRRFGIGDALVVGAGLSAQIVMLVWLGRYFDPRQVLRNYRRVMRVNTLSASALGAYLVVRLALGGSR
jgi:NAD(P)-dependent dehydrogenase (short-subunit alcohol dehydrogenase family)